MLNPFPSLHSIKIDLDEEQFQSMVRLDNDIEKVVKVIAAIMFEDESIDGKGLDEYAEQARLEETRQNELTGSLFAAGSALARLRKLASSASATSGEEYPAPMFVLQDQYTQGSVDVARGTRVTLSKSSHSQPSRALSIMRTTSNHIHENPIVKQAMMDSEARPPLERGREARDLSPDL